MVIGCNGPCTCRAGAEKPITMRNLKSTLSFWQRLRQQLFRHRVDFEIFQRIAPHLQGESSHDYPFGSDEEMIAITEATDLRTLIDQIEAQIPVMPKAYAQAFRYIMYRDIHARLTRYARLTQRMVPRRHEVPELARDCA